MLKQDFHGPCRPRFDLFGHIPQTFHLANLEKISSEYLRKIINKGFKIRLITSQWHWKGQSQQILVCHRDDSESHVSTCSWFTIQSARFWVTGRFQTNEWLKNDFEHYKVKDGPCMCYWLQISHGFGPSAVNHFIFDLQGITLLLMHITLTLSACCVFLKALNAKIHNVIVN